MEPEYNEIQMLKDNPGKYYLSLKNLEKQKCELETKITLKDIYDPVFEKKPKKIKFNIPLLDLLLEGGLDVGEFIQFYGDVNVGKTQLMLQLALNCQLSFDINSQKVVIFVTLEKSFPSKRIKRLKDFLKNTTKNSKKLTFNIISLEFNTLYAFVNDLIPIIDQFKDKVILVIFDMVDSIQREDSEGRTCFKCFSMLSKLAREYKFAVAMTKGLLDMSDIKSLKLNWNARITKRVFISNTEANINLNLDEYEDGIDMRIRKMKVIENSNFCYFVVTPTGIESVIKKRQKFP
ncbi:hypothetical protein PVAND_014274 [Polypedilum vanderplanki]|uniref:RecA family profile 1 domain-containing protein n=1 Tax=Polypedilum vanderplanki TaxID=319348 RepID=A0A9J6CS91_POLVA|nr:hypothetical protein PVAND_014274 [Polypedilum vanderplanki]